jgi:O-methyltransferase
MSLKSSVASQVNRILGRFGVRLVRSWKLPDVADAPISGTPDEPKAADPPPPDVWSHVRSPEILHTRVEPLASYSPWLSDTAFSAGYASVQDYTLVDQYRMYELWTLARQLRDVPGDFLEVGVWRGGSAALIGTCLRGTGKTLFLADTFTGVVKAGELDTYYVGGEHSDASRADVEGLLAQHAIANTVILEGIFPEETGGAVTNPLAFVHIDVDAYESARGILEHVKPLLSLGSVVVLDDYGFHGCEGVTRFVDEIRDSSGLLFVHNLNGHALLVKVTAD